MKLRTLTCITGVTLLVTLAISFPLAAQDNNADRLYQVTNLGTLGGTSSVANAVSNNRLVAGFANLSGDGSQHAFLWEKHSGMTDLGTLGGPNSFVDWPGINDRGQTVGASDTSNSDPDNENFCGFGTGLICLGFVWNDGVMAPLGTLGGNNSYATGVNNRGQAVGVAESTLDSSCTPPQVFDYQPVIWGPKPGEMHQLNPLSGDPVGYALAVNDEGEVVGATGPCVPLTTLRHAVLWEEDGTAINLGNLGGVLNNVATDINNRGEVVGGSDLAGETAGHAFLWTKDNGMQDLGTLSGDVNSFAQGINNRSQVVGNSCDATGNCRAFLWTKEAGMQDLNTLVCLGTTLYLTNNNGGDINDRGEIAGQAYDPNTGDTPAYLAVPARGKRHCDASARSGQKIILPERTRESWQQRRFGGRFESWYRGVAAERPVVKPTSAVPARTSSETTIEGAPEPSPSCSQGIDEQFGADHAQSGAITFVGYCQRNGTTGRNLTGSCSGRYLNQPLICLSLSDAQQCPPGAKAIKPSFIGCGSEHFWPVDIARSCSH